MFRDDCSSSTVSVFNNNPDHPEFYEHQTNKAEHRERVHNPAGSEYYEKASNQQGVVGGGNEYYEQTKKKEPLGSEYYAPLRLPVNCSAPEVELRTTSHSVSWRMQMKEKYLKINFFVHVKVFIKCCLIQVGTTNLEFRIVQFNQTPENKIC